jgi:hypothetical protein
MTPHSRSTLDRDSDAYGASRPVGDFVFRRYLRWRGERLYFGGLWVGEVMLWQSPPHVGRWRAWSTTEAPGAHHGWFATEFDAKRQVELVVLAALAGGPRDQGGAAEPGAGR